jgi:hypothetical protein
MASQPQHPQVTIKPEEDARLAPLEGYIESQWEKFRPKYYRMLKENGTLEAAVHQMGLMCVGVLNQYQNAGLGPDQGREAIQPLILPQLER